MQYILPLLETKRKFTHRAASCLTGPGLKMPNWSAEFPLVLLHMGLNKKHSLELFSLFVLPVEAGFLDRLTG